MNEVLKDKDEQILNPKIPRYEKIAEITSNANGTAIKFNSGFMICFGNVNVNVNGGSDYYGLFNRTVNVPVNLPAKYISTDDLTINLTSQNFGVFSANINQITTSNFSFYGFYPATVSFTSMRINYIACGRWK